MGGDKDGDVRADVAGRDKVPQQDGSD